MITTREAINYQFSIIFGYSSPKEEVKNIGNVIGPGKLTKKRVTELSYEVIKFLRMYNAMLRDYTGSEVFSIEFSLDNVDDLYKRGAQVRIYPKSMILIPGNYKECESLLLALKPETGYLDTHKSRRSVNNVCKLFYEVEEFTEHPGLNKEGKERVLKGFANRFSNKLYGELLEDKWNKKLIGLNVSLPTEQEMLETYATIKSEVKVLWNKSPYEISLFSPKFEKLQIPLSEKSVIEHLKYSISEPSANYVIENTLKLGANLMNLANTGTIDETQDGIMRYLINQIEEKFKLIKDSMDANLVISYNEKILGKLKSHLNKFLEHSKTFLSSGYKGSLSEILEKFKQFIDEKAKLENEHFQEICNLAINSIKQSVIKRVDLRAVELSSILYYFEEIIKNNFDIIKKSLPSYFARRRLKTLTKDFINRMNDKFDKEQKPAKILGQKFIEIFHHFLLNQIEINPRVLSKNLKYNEDDIINEFKTLIRENLESFFSNIELNISDLIVFAEVMMDKDSHIIQSHIEKFKIFSKELHYLLSYILRYSTVSRYLKDEPDEEILDPVTFANRFHRFLERKIGGIELVWKSYILEWIKDYAKKFFTMEEPKVWTLKEIHDDFISYLEDRESNEQKSESFLEFLDAYIGRVQDENEKSHLLDFFKQYELSIGIKTEFPKYVKNKIETEINSAEIKKEKLVPIQYFKIDDDDTFYSYIKEMELKYFSKLLPRPISLILKHSLTNEERELFKADLFHVFNFRFWGNDKLKIKISDNFKEVYREWVKEL